jgi:hypothetical protein
MSLRDEMNKEEELQQVYERIWLPPPVKHDPVGRLKGRSAPSRYRTTR